VYASEQNVSNELGRKVKRLCWVFVLISARIARGIGVALEKAALRRCTDQFYAGGRSRGAGGKP